jgi:hypothetical protein
VKKKAHKKKRNARKDRRDYAAKLLDAALDVSAMIAEGFDDAAAAVQRVRMGAEALRHGRHVWIDPADVVTAGTLLIAGFDLASGPKASKLGWIQRVHRALDEADVVIASLPWWVREAEVTNG